MPASEKSSSLSWTFINYSHKKSFYNICPRSGSVSWTKVKKSARFSEETRSYLPFKLILISCEQNSIRFYFKKVKVLSADFYHVGYTSSHTNTEVKQHWAWILLGWETLQEIPGSAGTDPLPPSPLQTEYSLFRLSLSQSSDWDPLKPKKRKVKFYLIDCTGLASEAKLFTGQSKYLYSIHICPILVP
jgi:hypothetical protein